MLFYQGKQVDNDPKEIHQLIKDFGLDKEYETFQKNCAKKKPAIFKLSERFKNWDNDEKREVYPASQGIPAVFKVQHETDIDGRKVKANVEFRYVEEVIPGTQHEAESYKPFNIAFYGEQNEMVSESHVEKWIFLMLHPWRQESKYSKGMNVFINFQSAKNARALVDLEKKITEAKEFITNRKMASMATLREVLKTYNHANVEEMEDEVVQSECYTIVNSGANAEAKIEILKTFIGKFGNGQDTTIRSEIRSMEDAGLLIFVKEKNGYYETKDGQPTEKLVCKVQPGKEQVATLITFFKHNADGQALYELYKEEMNKVVA